MTQKPHLLWVKASLLAALSVAAALLGVMALEMSGLVGAPLLGVKEKVFFGIISQVALTVILRAMRPKTP